MIAIFKYERLSDFCYICRCLNHQEVDCDEVVRLRKEGVKAQRDMDHG